MRAEDALREPERIERKIRALVAECDALRSSLLPGGINYELDRVQGGGPGDRFADVMGKIFEREEKIEELAARRKELLTKRIPKMLALVQDPEARTIINLHDIFGLSMDQIGVIVHRSRSGCYAIRAGGLRDIEESLDTLDSDLC